MFNGKHVRGRQIKRASVKITMLIMALTLVVTGVIGGTVAWLIDNTDPVTNTFTYGNIDIDLTESKVNPDGTIDATATAPVKENLYKMIPGNSYTKDPILTVVKDSEACWLFVELERKGGNVIPEGETDACNFDSYLEFVIADGWTRLAEETTREVYFREVAANETEDQIFHVLANDEIKVKTTVTKPMIDALEVAGEEYNPQLVLTGYAVQQANIPSAVEAWAAINPAPVNP